MIRVYEIQKLIKKIHRLESLTKNVTKLWETFTSIYGSCLFEVHGLKFHDGDDM